MYLQGIVYSWLTIMLKKTYWNTVFQRIFTKIYQKRPQISTFNFAVKFKGTASRDFLPLSFCLKDSTWASYDRAKNGFTNFFVFAKIFYCKVRKIACPHSQWLHGQANFCGNKKISRNHFCLFIWGQDGFFKTKKGLTVQLKGHCYEIFHHYLFCLKNATWARYEQAKMV